MASCPLDSDCSKLGRGGRLEVELDAHSLDQGLDFEGLVDEIIRAR